MNKTRRLLTVAAALALGGIAAAQTFSASPAAANHEVKAARLAKLGEVNLYDSNSRRIGEVEDLVIDPISGRVLHALVSIGGVIGIGDKEYTVPTSQLRVFSRSPEDGVPMKVELQASPDSLPSAKELDKDSPYVLASRLIGIDVNDNDGKDAGEIADLIVDLQSGQAKYALVAFDASWSAKGKLFPVKKSELKKAKLGKGLAMDVTRDSLNRMPSVEKSRIDRIDLGNASWTQAAAAPAGNFDPTGAAGGSTPAAGASADGASTAGSPARQ
jgi:sporulation protein YlmC with PRC-barrel domain